METKPPESLCIFLAFKKDRSLSTELREAAMKRKKINDHKAKQLFIYLLKRKEQNKIPELQSNKKKVIMLFLLSKPSIFFFFFFNQLHFNLSDDFKYLQSLLTSSQSFCNRSKSPLNLSQLQPTKQAEIHWNQTRFSVTYLYLIFLLYFPVWADASWVLRVLFRNSHISVNK